MDEAKLLRETTSLIREHVAKYLRHTPEAEGRMYLPAGSAEILASQVIDLVRAAEDQISHDVNLSDELPLSVRDVRRMFKRAGVPVSEDGTVDMSGVRPEGERITSVKPDHDPSLRLTEHPDMRPPWPAFPRYGRDVRLMGSEPIPSDGEPGEGAGPAAQHPTNPCVETYKELEHYRHTLPVHGGVFERTPRDLTIVPTHFAGFSFAGRPDLQFGISFTRSITFEGCTRATIVFNDGLVKWASLKDGKVVIEDATKPEPEPKPRLGTFDKTLGRQPVFFGEEPIGYAECPKGAGQGWKAVPAVSQRPVPVDLRTMEEAVDMLVAVAKDAAEGVPPRGWVEAPHSQHLRRKPEPDPEPAAWAPEHPSDCVVPGTLRIGDKRPSAFAGGPDPATEIWTTWEYDAQRGTDSGRYVVHRGDKVIGYVTPSKFRGGNYKASNDQRGDLSLHILSPREAYDMVVAAAQEDGNA